ncbi:MAG: gliding motility lipoprotein GldH [Prevotella sp.]|nr:gliding motility lipoprotein GldH [Prevotella sp.]
MQKRRHTLLYIGLGVVLFLISCNSRTFYNRYQHVPITGWEKNDAVTFGIPPIRQDGNYQETIGLRINGTYPFMGLTLIVDHTIYPSLETHSDTLSCSLIDEEGGIKGKGVVHYQYSFPINTLTLQEGDSLSINVHHDMKREILPGIADIGIILTRQP